jgi:hypothetical protein
VPRASVTQSADDLKARDMVLCRFPEVDMVVGKAGRAESPTDPAPMDMIETMVNFRPRELWPRRKLLRSDAERQTRSALDAIVRRGLIRVPTGREALIEETIAAALPVCDSLLREYAYQRNREFERELAGVGSDPDDPQFARVRAKWHGHVHQLNDELVGRAAETYTRLALEELLSRATVADPRISTVIREIRRLRDTPPPVQAGGTSHHLAVLPPTVEPLPALDAVQAELTRPFAAGLLLWRKDPEEMAGFGSDLDQAVQMPGWTTWCMPPRRSPPS